MATRDEIAAALRKAHAAGDTAGAKRLANAYRNASGIPGDETPGPDSAAIKASRAFDEMPWYMKVPQAADDVVRTGANAATLGLADKLEMMAGSTPEATQQRDLDAEARSGSASLGAKALGYALPASAASKMVGAVPGLGGMDWLASLAREGIAGAGVAGTEAAIKGEPVVPAIAAGGLGGIGGTMIGKGAVDMAGGVAKHLPTIPGVPPGILGDVVTPAKGPLALADETTANYKKVRDAGIDYDPAEVQKRVRTTRMAMQANDLDSQLHPTATRRSNLDIRRANRNRGGEGIPLEEVETMRRLVGRDVKEPFFAGKMRDDMDSFIKNVKPRNAESDVANDLIRNARGSSRRQHVSEDFEEAAAKATNRGTDTPFRTLLEKGRQGMTPEEYGKLEAIVRGETWQEDLSGGVAKAVGGITPVATAAAGFLGGGGPIGAAVGAGLGAAVPFMAKAGARKYKESNIQGFRDLVGGGKTVPAAAKQAVKNLTGGVGGGILSSELAEQRARQKRRRRR